PRTAPHPVAAAGYRPWLARRPCGGGRRSSAQGWPSVAPAVHPFRTQGCLPTAPAPGTLPAVSVMQAFAPLVDLVYPPRCPSCGEGIATQDGLCAACWAELAFPGEPACALCQRPFADELADGSVCAPCLTNPPRHDGIAAGTLYNDASRKLVLAFKHGRRIAFAPMLARMAAARLPELDGDWLVVPVPLHRWRLWRRGFNQSALLARERSEEH